MLVIHVHDEDHGRDAGRSPSHLPQQKAVGRTETLLRHDRRGAEDHHQSDEDQQQRDGEQPLVHTDALGHYLRLRVCCFPRVPGPALFRGHATHLFFEDPAAMLVAVELVEAGAGRGQQHHVSRSRRFSGTLHRILKRHGPDDFRAASPAIRSWPRPRRWCTRA